MPLECRYHSTFRAKQQTFNATYGSKSFENSKCNDTGKIADFRNNGCEEGEDGSPGDAYQKHQFASEPLCQNASRQLGEDVAVEE